MNEIKEIAKFSYKEKTKLIEILINSGNFTKSSALIAINFLEQKFTQSILDLLKK